MISKFHTLPLVESVCDLFNNIDFQDVFVVGAQHILPSTLEMLHSLMIRGLDPKNIALIGKCYSTDLPTYEQMKSLGIQVDSSSISFHQNISFDDQYKLDMQSFTMNVIKGLQQREECFQKIIVLDDGGQLIDSLGFHMFDIFCDVVCVEQTTSGYKFLKKQKLRFPVINVARSDTKLKYESPIVAKTLVDQLITNPRLNIHSNMQALIVGYGAIGRAVYDSLISILMVDYVDETYADGTDGVDIVKEVINDYDLVIGCTGETILNFDDRIYLKKDVILVSASSSDREFAASEYRREFGDKLDCHSDFSVQGITIVNSGFPANFSGNSALTDPPEFHLTRALLVAGILCGINFDYPNKIVDLNMSIQQKILELHQNLLSANR